MGVYIPCHLLSFHVLLPTSLQDSTGSMGVRGGHPLTGDIFWFHWCQRIFPLTDTRAFFASHWCQGNFCLPLTPGRCYLTLMPAFLPVHFSTWLYTYVHSTQWSDLLLHSMSIVPAVISLQREQCRMQHRSKISVFCTAAEYKYLSGWWETPLTSNEWPKGGGGKTTLTTNRQHSYVNGLTIDRQCLCIFFSVH